MKIEFRSQDKKGTKEQRNIGTKGHRHKGTEGPAPKLVGARRAVP